MKFQVVISRAAATDVDRLEAWLLDKDPSAALRVGPILMATIASLETLPERGRPVGVYLREMNARFGTGTYVIRYRVEGRRVTMTRIFHGRENR